MKAYADSSFVARLVLVEPESIEATAAYRQAGRPSLLFTPLHSVEVRNAIFLHAFQEKSLLPKKDHPAAARRRDAALARLESYLRKSLLARSDFDLNEALGRAEDVAISHSERLGVRTLDLLHVAIALHLNAEKFLTSDIRQSQLAKAVGLSVVAV